MQEKGLLKEAVRFAADKHAGGFRKGTNLPYITHPMEATAVCASFTEGVEVLAAAVLQVDLGHTAAWQEYRERVDKVLGTWLWE